MSTAFNQLDASLRREVELAGLMRFALRAGVPVEHARRAVYDCYDLEGAKRQWEAPDMVVVRESLQQGMEAFDVR